MMMDRKIGWTLSSASAGALVIAALAIGCGGGGGGGSATGATSTVSGNVSNQSTTMRLEARPTLFARLMHVLSPVTDAFAGRNGIQVTIGGTTTSTDPNGFFALTGPFSGPVTVAFG